MRTTLDLEKPVLDGLKAIQKKEKRSLSKIASHLLSEALAQHEARQHEAKPPSITWKSQPMGNKVNIADKDALYRVLDKA